MMGLLLFDPIDASGARFSECGKYRYALWRKWGPGSRFLFIIGLNPSVANAEENDPTIRREIGFAKALGFDGIYKGNLYGYVATDPKDMVRQTDRVGELNDSTLQWMSVMCERRVAAWGAHKLAEKRGAEVMKLIGLPFECWGKTASGEPKHPLYLPKTSVLEPYYSPTPPTPSSDESRGVGR